MSAPWFDKERAIALVKSRAVRESTHGWDIDDACEISIDDDGWMARVYMDYSTPDAPDYVEQWRAYGDSVESLEHFLRVYRWVPGSYSFTKVRPAAGRSYRWWKWLEDIMVWCYWGGICVYVLGCVLHSVVITCVGFGLLATTVLLWGVKSLMEWRQTRKK